MFRYHLVLAVSVDEGSGKCCLSERLGQVCRLQYLRKRRFGSEITAEILDNLKENYPSAPVIAVGISLGEKTSFLRCMQSTFLIGGIVLGNCLTDQREAVRDKTVAAMLISVCFNTLKLALSFRYLQLFVFSPCH